ncbi:MAG: tRNA (adenosine(37)-N6)-threonylcarbamoyltransferase complex dimerization subunit type 1 TsaB [Candidatus Krumholzibacteriota bacterium]
MLSLAIDTSTKWGRFALAQDGNILEYRPLNVSGSYADALLPVIEDMLAEAGRAKNELDRVGVTVGPGSFTGVRIGVATAKGLAWGLGCELVGVTSLAAMAAALLDEFPEAGFAVPVLDARRGEIFSGVFVREGTWVRPVAEPAALRPDQWWARVLETVDDPEQPVYGGDGTGLLLGQGKELRPELASKGRPVLRRWSSAHPATARALALAMNAGGLPQVHPFTLVPEYMRVSDAEVKRKLDLTPAKPGGDVSSHRSERPT